GRGPPWRRVASSRRKVVLGGAVLTRPSTSIASSLTFCMPTSVRGRTKQCPKEGNPHLRAHRYSTPVRVGPPLRLFHTSARCLLAPDRGYWHLPNVSPTERGGS